MSNCTSSDRCKSAPIARDQGCYMCTDKVTLTGDVWIASLSAIEESQQVCACNATLIRCGTCAPPHPDLLSVTRPGIGPNEWNNNTAQAGQRLSHTHHLKPTLVRSDRSCPNDNGRAVLQSPPRKTAQHSTIDTV